MISDTTFSLFFFSVSFFVLFFFLFVSISAYVYQGRQLDKIRAKERKLKTIDWVKNKKKKEVKNGNGRMENECGWKKKYFHFVVIHLLFFIIFHWLLIESASPPLILTLITYILIAKGSLSCKYIPSSSKLVFNVLDIIFLSNLIFYLITLA